VTNNREPWQTTVDSALAMGILSVPAHLERRYRDG